MKSWIGEKERKPNIVTQSRRVLRKKSLNLKLISLNPQNAGYSSPSKYTTSNNVAQPSKQQEPVWTTKNHHSISVTQFPSLITHHSFFHTHLATSFLFSSLNFFTLFMGPTPVSRYNVFSFFFFSVPNSPKLILFFFF